jgi:hypothetical protein
MSVIKSPQDKKRVSLELDRRNVYGENAKSSRKNIPRSKQASHQAERQAANRPLRGIKTATQDDDVIAAEVRVREELIKKRRTAFKKSPDAPLGKVLKRKGKR